MGHAAPGALVPVAASSQKSQITTEITPDGPVATIKVAPEAMRPLGGSDEKEFNFLMLKETQREGIAKAKADGKYKGCPALIDAYEVKRVASLVGPAAAKQLGIARSTVYRLLDQTPTSTTH
jgi:hypothetical protein